jgi:hypothetical protein
VALTFAAGVGFVLAVLVGDDTSGAVKRPTASEKPVGYGC